MDYDILKIIGDYVKEDNFIRMEEEEQNQKKKGNIWLFDFKMKHVRKEARKEDKTVGRGDARMCSFFFHLFLKLMLTMII